MNSDIVEQFVAKIHELVTLPAFRGSLGFLASAARGNRKYSELRAGADLYVRATDEERSSLNHLILASIQYGCFSFLDFLEQYDQQHASTVGKTIELRLSDANSADPPVDLFASSEEIGIRTVFRRYAMRDDWKARLAEQASAGIGPSAFPSPPSGG